MTGYGKATLVVCNKKITAEIKSLNSKQMDLSVKLPLAYRDIELELRNFIAKELGRGKVDVFIDDSVRIFEELNSKGIPCLLIDAPQNQNYETEYRIHSLQYSEIENAYNRLKNESN